MNRLAFRIALVKIGMPAIAVARKIGISHSTLSCWLNGYYQVPESHQRKLASVLRVKIHELFPGKEKS